MKSVFISIITLLLSLCFCCYEISGAVTNEMHFRMYASNESLPPDTRLAYIDSLIEVVPATADSLLFLSSNIAYDTGRYKRAQDAVRRLLNREMNGEQLPLNKRCEALFMLVKSNLKCNDYADAVETALNLLNLEKPDSLLYHDVECINILHDYTLSFPASFKNIFPDTSFFCRAEKIINESVARKVDSSVIAKMKKALIFSKMISAMENEEFNKALELGAEMLTYPINKVERLALEGNMAMIYHLLGDYDRAEIHYKQILSGPGWHLNHAICLENYMVLLTSTGRPEEAIEVMDAHPELLPIVKGSLQYVFLLRRRSNALAACGKIKEAYEMSDAASVLDDSIQKTINSDYAAKLLSTIETRNEIHSLQQQNNRYSSAIIWLIVLAGILLAGVMFMIIKYVVPVIRKRGIQTDVGGENVPATAEGSSPEIGELAVRTLQLASTNEMLSDISAITSNVNMSEKEKLDKINSLMKEVASYGDLWDSFQILFEKLHPKLFSVLKDTYPDLTQGETRMCAYVMLNLSNKEIASLTRRNVRSVETMRYRLTKKMNLSEGETLSMRLNSISTLSLKGMNNLD